MNSANTVAFLPWLTLDQPYRVACIEFIPWKSNQDTIDIAEAFTKIFSSYVEVDGTVIDDCVIIKTKSDRYTIDESDFGEIQWATSLLFLSAWAQNKYFTQALCYTNSSYFRIMYQKFTDALDGITLESRRRDGSNLSGGYEHGEVKFSEYIQCSRKRDACIDNNLLTALNNARENDSKTIKLLKTALPYVELANTDDSFMTIDAEAILMGSAFEQLLVSNNPRNIGEKLGNAFSSIMKQFGSITAEKAQANREFNISDSKCFTKEAQLNWYVHRTWIQELYQLRNKFVHEGTDTRNSPGWTPAEHLVMAAYIFPLVVKLLLQDEGYYTLTHSDIKHCLAVDKLLAEEDWKASWSEVQLNCEWDAIPLIICSQMMSRKSFRN